MEANNNNNLNTSICKNDNMVLYNNFVIHITIHIISIIRGRPAVSILICCRQGRDRGGRGDDASIGVGLAAVIDEPRHASSSRGVYDLVFVQTE